MVFQEPKVELVFIDMTANVNTTSPGQAGYEACTGPEAPSNRCDYAGTYWLDGNGNQWSPS